MCLLLIKTFERCVPYFSGKKQIIAHTWNTPVLSGSMSGL